MVYASYQAVKEMMRLKDSTVSNEAIYINWLRILGWYPTHRSDFDAFKQQFPSNRSSLACRIIDSSERHLLTDPSERHLTKTKMEKFSDLFSDLL